MKAVVLGGTGGCGAPCLLRLLERGVSVTAIVRSADRLPAAAKGHAKLTVVVVPEGHLALSTETMAQHLSGADAVVSSLGAPRNSTRNSLRTHNSVALTADPTQATT